MPRPYDRAFGAATSNAIRGIRTSVKWHTYPNQHELRVGGSALFAAPATFEAFFLRTLITTASLSNNHVPKVGVGLTARRKEKKSRGLIKSHPFRNRIFVAFLFQITPIPRRKQQVEWRVPAAIELKLEFKTATCTVVRTGVQRLHFRPSVSHYLSGHTQFLFISLIAIARGISSSSAKESPLPSA